MKKHYTLLGLLFSLFNLFLFGTTLDALYESKNYLQMINEINDHSEDIKSNKELSYIAYMYYKDLNIFNESASYLDAVRKIENSDELNLLADELKNIISAYNSCKNDYDKATNINDLNQILENIVQYNSKYSDISNLYKIQGKVYEKYHLYSKNSNDLNLIEHAKNNYYLTLAVESYRKAFDLNKYEFIKEDSSLIKLEYSNEIRNISKKLVAEGKDQLKTGAYNECKKSFQLAIEFDNDYGISYFYLGEFYKKNSDFENAIDNYKKGIDKAGFNKPVLHSVGYCYEKINDRENAIKAYEEVLDIDPFYTKSKFALANIYYSTQIPENLQKAESYLRDITIDEPDYESAYYVLASIYFDSKDFILSKSICEEGLEFIPRSYKLHYKKALACNELNLFEEARIHAELSIKENKKYYPAIYELGLSWMNLCNQYEAEKSFKKAARDRKFKKEANKYLDGALQSHIKENCKN